MKCTCKAQRWTRRKQRFPPFGPLASGRHLLCDTNSRGDIFRVTSLRHFLGGGRVWQAGSRSRSAVSCRGPAEPTAPSLAASLAAALLVKHFPQTLEGPVFVSRTRGVRAKKVSGKTTTCRHRRPPSLPPRLAARGCYLDTAGERHAHAPLTSRGQHQPLLPTLYLAWHRSDRSSVFMTTLFLAREAPARALT